MYTHCIPSYVIHISLYIYNRSISRSIEMDTSLFFYIFIFLQKEKKNQIRNNFYMIIAFRRSIFVIYTIFAYYIIGTVTALMMCLLRHYLISPFANLTMYKPERRENNKK